MQEKLKWSSSRNQGISWLPWMQRRHPRSTASSPINGTAARISRKYKSNGVFPYRKSSRIWLPVQKKPQIRKSNRNNWDILCSSSTLLPDIFLKQKWKLHTCFFPREASCEQWQMDIMTALMRPQTSLP